MGAEFIRQAAKSFTKSWDHARRKLATSDLFTLQPDSTVVSAPFELIDGTSLCPGDYVTVERLGGELIARKGLRDVARNSRPPAELLKAVENSCGIAKGTVDVLHSISKVAEISLR